MNCFGITGGVGMGKSTVGETLRSFGIPLIDTDDLARNLTQPGAPSLQKIHETFGDFVFHPDFTLNRAALAALVFSDSSARLKLETILHPAIRSSWRETIQQWTTQRHAMAAVIIPLLFETGAEGEFSHVICVACTRETQQSRLEERGWNKTHIAGRISAQLPIEEKILRSDFVIWTEGRRELQKKQAKQLIEDLSKPSRLI
ncbi:MAG: dephospho-CoA kinase [Verrucomicrobiota bacterium]|nr:dephospho-CoA kinase [Verrucomicrobiota bacterium]